MSFLKLCKDDKLLSLLSDTFKANPIRIPEERIKPLTVVSKEGQRIKFIGDVKNLLKDNSKLEIEIQSSQMADLSATKTKAVDTTLGLKVMDGFLKGLGANGASIDFAFKGVNKISFSFGNVQRKYIDIGMLVSLLSKTKFSKSNPVNQYFIEDKSQCIIVDSIITSNNFSIKMEDEGKTDFSFNIPEIEKVLSSEKNKVKVDTSSKLEISFTGEKQLAFAFTGTILDIDTDGNISFEGEPDRSFLTKEPSDKENISIPLNFMISDDIGLNEIEFD